MADREEVLKGLEHHRRLEASRNELGHDECFDCPYRPYGEDTCASLDRMIDDALKLLRDQPEQKHGHWIEYPKCLEYDGALDDTYIVCSACEHVFNVIDNCTELFDYCPKCGSKMNEENEKEK